MESPRREWLDWSKPCIPAAAAWLIENHEGNGVCDLRDVLCVLPGRRAGRLLLSHLVQQCQARNTQFFPPTVLTPGAMIDALLEPDGAVASEVEIAMAWMKAIQKSAAADLEPLFSGAGEDRRNILDLWPIACVFASLHAELSAQRRSFSDVADRAERLEMLSEGARWRALETLHRRYLAALAGSRLADPHQAREKALAERKADARRPKAVMYISVELNALQRALIQSFGDRATALIHAPPKLADHFDSLGCVIPEKWADFRIELNDERIHIVDRPDDQAQAALRSIAQLNGEFSAAQITIGLGDPSIAPAIAHAAEWAGLSVRSAEGILLRASPPCLALEAIADYLDDPRFANLAALLRHPDIEAWIGTRAAGANGASDWLTILDRYFTDYLHGRLTESWLGDERTRGRMSAVHDAVQKLIAPLRGEFRPLASWAHPILDVLASLYQTNQHIEACLRLRDMLADFVASSPPLQPDLSAADAIRLLLLHLGAQPLPEELEDHQIEMLGWLELHLDPAPALIITGFNEGGIPQSATADAFLPDSLRSLLGLACNQTRYARDAYLLEATRRSRPHLTLIAGRRTGGAGGGEPLTPSRLLLACDSETLVRRVAAMCDAPSGRRDPIGIGAKTSAESRFDVPKLDLLLPSPSDHRESMTITEFKEYIQCPYRYALKRLLRLESLDDTLTELDPLRFGILAHAVLCRFGQDGDINSCENPEKIERYLSHAMSEQLAEQFGRAPMPAVRVQAARLEQRLHSFARRQAVLCAEGWRIRHCELAFDREISLDVPGQDAMPLRGKIDRIDFNERTGAWRIIDYKTGDSGESPIMTHHGREAIPAGGDLAWFDLQLPLYHFLATRSPHHIGGDVRLAYICLPRQSDGACISEASWSPANLEHALETARDIVRSIRARQFSVNPDFDGRFDAFARICQTTVFTEREIAEAPAETVNGDH